MLEFWCLCCSPVPVRKLIPWIEYSELAGVFFLQSMAVAMWLVPLGVVLEAHGLHQLTPYAFATTAIAAFISPLIFGAMADRHASPVTVLRWLAVTASACMAVVALAIHRGWNPWLVLGLIQVQALFATPTGSITTTIIFARLRDSQKEFGPIRATATFGWMCGCWLVSALNADASVRAAYATAVMWLVLAGFTLLLPTIPPPGNAGATTWRQRLGWDALQLLKNHDHRVVFITLALFYIPLSAFYPFTPRQMLDLGLKHTSAWMTLGQTSEIIAMFCLSALLANVRLKWIFTGGLAFGVVRFALCALNGRLSVLAGVSLHGLSFVLFLITVQVYVDQRVDPAWKARAQGLVYLVANGVGNLLGYLSTGWWFGACTPAGGTKWPLFWVGNSAAVAVVMVYFLLAFHGIGRGLRRANTNTPQ